MYTTQVVQLATKYSSPGRLLGKRGQVFGDRKTAAVGMQSRRLFG